MTIERLASDIYNNVVSGLGGINVNDKFSIEQIEDDIINERLTIIKENALKGILPATDLMLKINCVPLDDLQLNKCGLTDGWYRDKHIKHFEIPQIVYDFNRESIGYVGPVDGSYSMTVYVDRHAWLNNKYRRNIKIRDFALIDMATNENDMYDGWIISDNEIPEDTTIMIVAIWKDPRQLSMFQCCPFDEINNWTYISNDIIKRLTEKYLRYYRQLAMPPTPSDLTNK